MISREKLAQEYVDIITSYYPISGQLLRCCLVRVLDLDAKHMQKKYYYLGIYYPERIGDRLLEHKDLFKDIAENMGLTTVVFLNASHLVRDPLSKIKQQDFRFWLELCWIASEVNQ
jgi:hypothetical protein